MLLHVFLHFDSSKILFGANGSLYLPKMDTDGQEQDASLEEYYIPEKAFANTSVAWIAIHIRKRLKDMQKFSLK